jgi:hypothetical protein
MLSHDREVEGEDLTWIERREAAHTVLSSKCIMGESQSLKPAAETRTTRYVRVIDRARTDESWLMMLTDC